MNLTELAQQIAERFRWPNATPPPCTNAALTRDADLVSFALSGGYVVNRPQCMGCQMKADSLKPDCWIIETRPTLGGTTLQVSLCFRCRRLVTPYAGSEKCDGRCGGDCDSAMAWHGWCTACIDIDDAVYEGKPSPFDEINEWSCFDEHCVLAWADYHHSRCDVTITRGSRSGVRIERSHAA